MKKRKPKIGISYTVIVKDKKGRVIQKVEKKSTKSFVKNFMEMLKAWLTGGIATIDDINGVTKNVHGYYADSSNYFEKCDTLGAEGEDDRGIVVGTGTTAVSPYDNKLESQVPHGDGDGYLHYQAGSITDVQISDNEISFEYTRNFVNNGTVTINVNEIGLYAKLRSYEEGSVQEISAMFIRDVLGSAVSVPEGATLTVKYKIKVTA